MNFFLGVDGAHIGSQCGVAACNTSRVSLRFLSQRFLYEIMLFRVSMLTKLEYMRRPGGRI